MTAADRAERDAEHAADHDGHTGHGSSSGRGSVLDKLPGGKDHKQAVLVVVSVVGVVLAWMTYRAMRGGSSSSAPNFTTGTGATTGTVAGDPASSATQDAATARELAAMRRSMATQQQHEATQLGRLQTQIYRLQHPAHPGHPGGTHTPTGPVLAGPAAHRAAYIFDRHTGKEYQVIGNTRRVLLPWQRAAIGGKAWHPTLFGRGAHTPAQPAHPPAPHSPHSPHHPPHPHAAGNGANQAGRREPKGAAGNRERHNPGQGHRPRGSGSGRAAGGRRQHRGQ